METVDLISQYRAQTPNDDDDPETRSSTRSSFWNNTFECCGDCCDGVCECIGGIACGVLVAMAIYYFWVH